MHKTTYILYILLAVVFYERFMRDLREIYDEVSKQCCDDNCQSVPVIAVAAMEKAIEEYKMFIVEKLEQLSNNYEVSNGLYLIQKHTLDNFTEQLEGGSL